MTNETNNTATANKIETGKVYYSRSIADYNCIHTVEVTRRTEKTVWFVAYGKEKKARIKQSKNSENFMSGTWFFSSEYEAPQNINTLRA